MAGALAIVAHDDIHFLLQARWNQETIIPHNYILTYASYMTFMMTAVGSRSLTLPQTGLVIPSIRGDEISVIMKACEDVLQGIISRGPNDVFADSLTLDWKLPEFRQFLEEIFGKNVAFRYFTPRERREDDTTFIFLSERRVKATIALVMLDCALDPDNVIPERAIIVSSLLKHVLENDYSHLYDAALTGRINREEVDREIAQLQVEINEGGYRSL